MEAQDILSKLSTEEAACLRMYFKQEFVNTIEDVIGWQRLSEHLSGWFTIDFIKEFSDLVDWDYQQMYADCTCEETQELLFETFPNKIQKENL